MADSLHRNFLSYKYWIKRKKNDFSKKGYDNVSLDDLWLYFSHYRWKHHRPDHYIQAVREILTLTPNEYFNYATLKAQVYDVKDMEEYDLSQLF